MRKGSTTSRSDYPKHCARCTQPVRVTKDNCWYETTLEQGIPVDRSWHAHCRTGGALITIQPVNVE